jgi:hypothetical protein
MNKGIKKKHEQYPTGLPAAGPNINLDVTNTEDNREIQHFALKGLKM